MKTYHYVVSSGENLLATRDCSWLPECVFGGANMFLEDAKRAGRGGAGKSCFEIIAAATMCSVCVMTFQIPLFVKHRKTHAYLEEMPKSHFRSTCAANSLSRELLQSNFGPSCQRWDHLGAILGRLGGYLAPP